MPIDVARLELDPASVRAATMRGPVAGEAEAVAEGAISCGKRHMRGGGSLPCCGRGVTVPNSTWPNPSAAPEGQRHAVLVEAPRPARSGSANVSPATVDGLQPLGTRAPAQANQAEAAASDATRTAQREVVGALLGIHPEQARGSCDAVERFPYGVLGV